MLNTKNQLEIKKYITPEIKKKLNQWEINFVKSLSNKKDQWSTKQVEVFNKLKLKYNIYDRKVVAGVLYLSEGYARGASTIQKITTRKMRKNRNIGNKKP